MKFREYRFLKKLHEISPEMDENQKYPSHLVSKIEKLTKMNKSDILSLAKRLASRDYVSLIQNHSDSGGYIHAIAISYSGVAEMRHYFSEVVMKIVWSIIIPIVLAFATTVITYIFSANSQGRC